MSHLFPPGMKSVPSSTIFLPKDIEHSVSPGGLKEVLTTLEREKKQTIEKWDKAIAAVEAITPRDMNVKISLQMDEASMASMAAAKKEAEASIESKWKKVIAEGKKVKIAKLITPNQPLVGHQRTVLRVFSDRGSTTLPDIVKKTKLERSHVAGILTILTRRGYAKRVGRGKYMRA